MICPAKLTRTPKAQDLVGEALREIASRQLTLELLTESKDEARWNQLIRKHHYLKEHRLVGESLRYVVKQNGKWIALLGWSSAAFHLRPRDAWIGWTDAQRQAGRHLLACNARFALLQPKGQSPNLASQILSLNLKHLSEDWQLRYGHPILLVETYVDPERFHGTCYRAANCTEIGVTQGFGRSRLEFYQLHQKPKAIFLYELHPKARKILSAPVMPSPWSAPKLSLDQPANQKPAAGPRQTQRSAPLQRPTPSTRRFARGHRHGGHDRRQ